MVVAIGKCRGMTCWCSASMDWQPWVMSVTKYLLALWRRQKCSTWTGWRICLGWSLVVCDLMSKDPIANEVLHQGSEWRSPLWVGLFPHVRATVAHEGPVSVTESQTTSFRSLWPERCDPLEWWLHPGCLDNIVRLVVL